MRAIHAISIMMAVLLWAPTAGAQMAITPAPETAPAASKFRSADDGWLDVSGFLDEKYGFLPIVRPITEPAVGYGAFGALAFISQPLGETRAGFGRPDITMVGGLGTENGSWGVMAGDVRHWLDDRLQTQAGFVHLSTNLDFHGPGPSGRVSVTHFSPRASRSTRPRGRPVCPTSGEIRMSAG
jgi:hypothetical protein